MPIRQGSPVLRDIADLSELCRVSCERALARCADLGGDLGGEIGRMGPVLLAAASMSRMCAATLEQCSSLAADQAMVRMSVRAMCGESARLLSLCAEACLGTSDREVRDVAVLLTRCADLCALLNGPAKAATVPAAALPVQTRRRPARSRGAAGVS